MDCLYKISKFKFQVPDGYDFKRQNWEECHFISMKFGA